MAQPSDYEDFQQRIFDQLRELEEAEHQGIVIRFVERGKRCGVDVMTEILDKRKSVDEVFAAIDQKESK